MEQRADSVLLEELVAGSEVALAAIYERHRRPVYAQGYAEVGTRVDAEEVLQDTFLTLWQKRRGIRLVDGSMLPWLLVTAKNHSRNRRRYQARRAASQLPDDPMDLQTDPACLAEQHELADVLAEALEALSPLDQQIVQLCLVEGLSYQHVAVHLRSTHATVRNRLSRARKLLRLRLEAEAERGRA